MPDKLRRLLRSHEFLERALKEYGTTLVATDAENLRQDRDRVFLELIEHTSADPRVTTAQINFLLSGLVGLAADANQAKRLAAACMAHVERLASQVQQAASQPGVAINPSVRLRRSRLLRTNAASSDYSIFDNLSDRVGILDRSYRYVFTNRSNAAFHGRRQDDFVGATSWSIIGEKCFTSLTKAKLDECFSGKTVSFVAAQRTGGTSTVYSVRFDPIRDQRGEVISALVIARDVTSLALPVQYEWPLPHE